MKVRIPLFVACAFAFAGCTVSSSPVEYQTDGGGSTVIDGGAYVPPAPVEGDGTRVVGENETLSVSNAWSVAELQQRDALDAVIWTSVKEQEVREIPVRITGWVNDPQTGDRTRPYLKCETTDAPFWKNYEDVAAGMSGSALVVQGRLAGALSFGYGEHNTEGHITFLATPFQYMYEAATFTGNTHGFDIASWYGAASYFGDPAVAGYFAHNPQLQNLPAARQDGRARGGWGSANPAPNKPVSTHLRPGSPVSMNFVGGDLVNAGAGCTVTAVDGNTLWICGHPITAVGNDLSVPMSAAWVNAVLTGPWGTYKDMGPVGPTLGAFTGDWLTAVVGTLGASANTIHVQTTVQRSDISSAVSSYQHEVARAGGFDWIGYTAVAAAVAPLDRARDYVGLGSATVRVRLTFLDTTVKTDVTTTVNAQYDLSYEVADVVFSAVINAVQAKHQLGIVSTDISYRP